ncbi:MAG: cob(I)yrinic acid a,c-diamide adenosyltransferase [Verrucomicrobiota bacterium]|jgi:cob(I)alamin adenosyltransferase
MSIVTKTGDKGTTALMYGRRVMKCHPQVEACGAVDELNSALGFARATAGSASARENILAIQKELVNLMGELAVASEDLERYIKDGYSSVTPDMTFRLERQVFELEAGHDFFAGWAMPGANVHSAALDAARSVCRRAERSVAALQQDGQLRNAEVLIYLNRLSDLLWLLARKAETPAAGA